MSTDGEVLKESAVRVVVVGGLAVISGLILFGSKTLNPVMGAFRYVADGVTIGIAYAAFKSGQVRNGFAAELIWYMLIMTLMGYSYGWWNYVMTAAYMVGLTAAVYLLLFFIKKNYVRGLILRFVAAVIILVVAYWVIILFLQVVNRGLFVNPLRSFKWVFMFTETGAIIGALCAIGMELSEYVITLPIFRPKVVE